MCHYHLNRNELPKWIYRKNNWQIEIRNKFEARTWHYRSIATTEVQPANHANEREWKNRRNDDFTTVEILSTPDTRFFDSRQFA